MKVKVVADMNKTAPSVAVSEIDPISQAVRDARKALKASPEFKALEAAERAQALRSAQTARVRTCLQRIEKDKIALPREDMALLRKAATVLGHNEVGADAVEALLLRVGAALEEETLRRSRAMFAPEPAEFTPEDRRLILSVLHPDNSASTERREAAFKAFSAKA
jgi:hypothetical protein